MNKNCFRLIPVAALSCLAAIPLRADVGIGSPRAEVVAELGAPSSRMAVGDYEVMTYSRGNVTVEDGVVTKLNLLSKEEWERRENRRVSDLRVRSESDAREAARVAALRREDDAALTRLLASPDWAGADPAARIALLDRLAITNPYADTGSLRAAAGLRQERDDARRSRLEGLEQRVADAEARAGEAETRARIAESNAVSASADAENARRAADAARTANTVSTGILAYSYIGGYAPRYGYDHYGRGATVVVGPGATVVTNGGAAVVRPPVRAAVRPGVREPAVVRVVPSTAAHPGVGGSGPPSSQKR